MTAIVASLAESYALKTLSEHFGAEADGVNVGREERWISGAAGAALLGLALRRRGVRAIALPLGGALLARAFTGRCAVNRALGRDTAHLRRPRRARAIIGGEGVRVEEWTIIHRPVEELYAFWRDFENLPRIMRHLDAVRVDDDERSHWIAKGPAGTHVEWDAIIHNELENELIAWRSLPGSDVRNVGSVHFRPTLEGTATEVRVVLRYDPPAGKLGAAIARLFGEEPSQQISDDLERFKRVAEQGGFASQST